MLKIIVVGAGINGVTSAIELRKRGHQVVLIDPGPIPHPLAASTDISKAVRAGYGADEDYTDLAEDCIRRWRQWNVGLGTELYHEIGVLFLRFFRERRGLAMGLVAALGIISVGYCEFYIPRKLAHKFNRFADSTAPAFALMPVSSGKVPVSPTPGKILVLDFFSTSCAPCIAELPELAAVRTELKDNRDIEFVIAASELGNDTPERFRAFIERRHINIPLAFDHDGKVHDSFGLHGVPALVVLDREGRVRLTRAGYNPAETSFHRDLVQFLKSL